MQRTIGIDLGVTSRSRLAVAEGSTVGRNRRVRSTPAALTEAIAAAADGADSVSIVVESTAMAWFVAAVAARRAGVQHRLYRVSGRKAAALRAFYREHTKNDRIDAPVLARMPLVDDGLRALRLPSAQELALKRLVTERHRLGQDISRIKNRLRSCLHWAAPGLLAGERVSDGMLRILNRWPDLRKLAVAQAPSIAREGALSVERARRVRDAAREAAAFYDEHLDFDALAFELQLANEQLTTLHRQLARLDARIRAEHQRAYPNEMLLTLPGVGPVVASAIRATVGDASAFRNAAAFRSYTGLLPREDSSGDTENRGRISKAGPNLLRWALYIAADTARKHDPHLADLYRRLMVERGRHHNQATCAVATHLTDRIYALLREQRPYQYRDLHGAPITATDAKRIATSLAVDAQTRQRLRRQKQRGPHQPRPRQHKAPQGKTRPSPKH